MMDASFGIGCDLMNTYRKIDLEVEAQLETEDDVMERWRMVFVHGCSHAR